ncbi:hypothetical protein V8J82_14155 [Gymnodinialimonas sp. 2305UL16-5]|uniref:hypothetical protein n=1 Tax=Gymnodinialimonas mytili TaxID=3126503 RepID=UPI0030A479A3
MRAKVLAICFGLSAAILANQAKAIEICPRSDRYTCVVDGGTLWLDGINYRLRGYDTPEEHTNICGGFREIDLAREATQRLIELLNQNDWEL